MEVLKLEGTGTISVETDSVANIDVPEDGNIVAFSLSIEALGIGPDEGARGELSFLATNSFGVNDTRGSIAQVQGGASYETSGGFNNTYSAWLAGLNIPVVAGERIYIHTKGDTGVTPRMVAYVYVEFKGGRRARRRT